MSDRPYSINEAAFVVERPAKVLTREFDEGVLSSGLKAKGNKLGRHIRVFGPSELRFFRLMKHWENDFTPDGRRNVFRCVRNMGPHDKYLVWRNARYDMSPIDQELKQREASLEALRSKFVRTDGDVFFEGTDISAYRVAALTESQSIDEIAEDYPSLTLAMIKDAIDYEKVYPKKGKPYPTRSLKRTLIDMGRSLDSETLDLLFGEAGPAVRED